MAGMRLHLTRLDERRYETVIVRDDGVYFHVQGVGHMFAIPHDLAHFAIEGALQLRRGFWGSVADGAVVDSMTHVSGRRRPRAAERSREVLRANHHELMEAECLVRLFNDALEEGHGPHSPVLRTRLADYLQNSPGPSTRRVSDAEIEGACAAWRRMLEQWRALPVGGTLELSWSAEAPPRRRRRAR